MELETMLFQTEYKNREKDIYHSSYEAELYFYQAVANGDVDYINAVSSQEHFEDMEGLGLLSQNSIKNVQFHYVISVALVSRACINAGMPPEEGFRLSDFYIQQLENCTTPCEIDNLTYQMNIEFTKRMQVLRNMNGYSKAIRRCIDYIYRNLHGKITVTELANHVHLNRSHLSRIFKKETGFTIQQYILEMKLKESKGMLKYLDYTCNEIAHNLGFSSQSHFTNIFKLHTGMTPNTYRKLYEGKAHYN